MLRTRDLILVLRFGEFQHHDAPLQLRSHHAHSGAQTGLFDCLTSYLDSSLSHEHQVFSPKHAPSF